MNDERCRTCRYWKKKLNGLIAQLPENGPGYCSNEYVQHAPPAYQDQGLSHDGYCDSAIVTGPDFGCIHWEGQDDD